MLCGILLRWKVAVRSFGRAVARMCGGPVAWCRSASVRFVGESYGRWLFGLLAWSIRWTD